MRKQPDFTDISADLIHHHRDALITLLQREGVLIPPTASDGQLINAYLTTVADSADFRKRLTDYVYGGKSLNADGSTWCDPNDPANDNNTACPQYWAKHPMDDGTTVAAPTTDTAKSKGGFLSGLGNVLSSSAFQTVLDTASNALNNSAQLKQQANQIKLKQLDLANNSVLANAGLAPAGTKPAGMSTGGKIALIVGILVVVGGIIIVVSKKKTTISPYNPKPVKAKLLSPKKPLEIGNGK